MRNHIKTVRDSYWNEIVLMLLGLTSVALLIYEFSADLLAAQVAIIHAVDFMIAMVFLADFLFGLYAAGNRKQYWRKEWYMLLASIPISGGVASALRSVRLLRLVRLIRVLARIKKMGELAEEVSADGSRYIYVAAITTIVIFSGATALFTLEVDANPAISNFYDAVWWAVVTTTTVGYGDIFPITWEGRLVGMAMMVFGIGLVGTVAGLVGHQLLKPKSKKP